MSRHILKGSIAYSKDKDTLITKEKAYIVTKDGICQGVYDTISEIPEEYKEFPVIDYGDDLIIPGLSDLHVHAPQFAFRGLGMDMELLDWLNTYAFPEEAKYKDAEYAENAYEIFAEEIKKSATTRACIFATIHNEATIRLMDLLEQTGIKTYVGKVNMDRNSPDYLIEKDAETSEKATKEWLESIRQKNYKHTRQMITPRFTPSCTDDLMERLGNITEEYHIPVQSHLSENQGEIEWVKELEPWSKFYGQCYSRFGMFGEKTKTVMAHCVYSCDDEINLMKKNGVFIAHCPQSNTNLSSGVAPVRKYLDMGLNVGLGSDIAGGSSISILRAMTDAIQASKLRWRLMDQSLGELSMEEAFYMGTKGGGAFFGKVGSFEKGYEMDAVVMNDSILKHPQHLSVRERLERVLYLADDRCIRAKYVSGEQIMSGTMKEL